MANTHKVSFKLNGKAVEVDGRAARAADPHAARAAGAHRPAHRLRNLALRRLHGGRGRHVGQVLHGADGAVRRRATMLTVEGLEQGGVLHALQQAFHEEHGLQCGYCTPGMLTRAYRLLQGEPEPERAGDPLRHLRQPVPLHRLPEHRQGRAVRRAEAGRRAPRRLNRSRHTPGDTPWATCPNSRNAKTSCRAWAPPCCARRTRTSSAARAATSTTSSCRACCSARIVRSPYAHARIKGIDKTKALACPGVVAVLTADDLKPVNLHWMPTAGRRRAGGAGRQEGLLPAAGSGDGAGHRPLRRRRRRRAGRGGLRGAAGHRRPEEGDGHRTRRSSARTSPTRRKSATARARTRTTSSPGRPATRRRPTRRSQAPR